MQVLKFGGTSMASAAAIRQVIRVVQGKAGSGPLVVVVSAMSGVTDLLLGAARLAAVQNEGWRDQLREIEYRHLAAVQELLPVTEQSALLSEVKKACNELEDFCSGISLLQECTPRTRDRLTHYGEWLSSRIIAAAFRVAGMPAQWKDARELIRTDSRFTAAEVDAAVTNQQISAWFHANPAPLTIVPGFIASDAEGVTTTLGRGGSDYTGAILAAALQAEVLEIWTDVSGMMTADPRLSPNAKIIDSISYAEAMELSHFGAKVIYPPTLQPVMNRHIPLRIRNTFAPEDPGTLVQEGGLRSEGIITGISSINQIALLSLEGSGMVGIPGFSRRLFEALSQEQINVILITQGSSEHSICVGVATADAGRAKEAVDRMFVPEITLGKLEPLRAEADLSIVALVGENMKNHTGVSGRMFAALGRNGVNIRAIAQGSSEKNISAVIATTDVKKAVNVLHEEFFEATLRQINLFIAGTGQVGTRLLSQLAKQQDWLMREGRLQIRVTGIINSRTMRIEEEGIPLDQWDTWLAEGPRADLGAFLQEIVRRNLRNSVWVDMTAHEAVAGVYDSLLRQSVAVVACNKIAASSGYERYRQLKELAREYNTRFLFETNVGAGLPVIATLNDLVHSGDRVRSIRAVLSGTLNFVFNHYDGSRPFAQVVRQAQAEGYTEPDPRLDLGGTDVMRKILILAREAGYPLEMAEVVNESFLPESCMQGSVEDFYRELENQEPHFQALLKAAQEQGGKLKFVAQLEDGKATTGLRLIRPGEDLYHLYGKDNIVLFHTDRYPEQPLVIKGAGAGADVTASGVFADIMRAV